MTHKKALILIYFAALIVCAGCGGGGGGQAPTPLAPSVVSGGSASKITGTVYTVYKVSYQGVEKEIQVPLSGIDVLCGEVASKTDKDGKFSIVGVRSKTAACGVVKKGYVAKSIDISGAEGVDFNATATILIPTSPCAAMVVSGESVADFSVNGFSDSSFKTGALISGLGEGAYEIAVSGEGYESVKARTVNIVPGATPAIKFDLVKKMTSIDIEWDKKILQVGDSYQFKAKCEYYDDSVSECAEQLKWSVSPKTMGTITDRGLFSAIAPGSARITATRGESNITHPGASVTVVCPDNTSWVNGACVADSLVDIKAVSSDIKLQKGGSAEIEIECIWRLAGNAPCPEIMWSSADPHVATVSESGIITGVSAGKTLATAAVENSVAIQVSVEVEDTNFPDISCEGIDEFCLDINGGVADENGLVKLDILVSNLPVSGLGAGIVTLEWEPGTLIFDSSAPGEGMNGIGASVEDGSFVFVFSASEPLVEDSSIFSVEFLMPDNVNTPCEIKMNESLKATNFTDYGMNLISQSGVKFKEGYAVPN